MKKPNGNHNQPSIINLKLVCNSDGTFAMTKSKVAEPNSLCPVEELASSGVPLTLKLVGEGKSTRVCIIVRGGVEYAKIINSITGFGGLRRLVLKIKFVPKKSDRRGGFGGSDLKIAEKPYKDEVSNHEIGGCVYDLGLGGEEESELGFSGKTLNLNSACLRKTLKFEVPNCESRNTHLEEHVDLNQLTGAENSQNQSVECNKGLIFEDHVCSGPQSEKVFDVVESHKTTKNTGSLPGDVSGIDTDVTDSKLHKINIADLEYIKEVGSGAYGTVSYGRWNARDVAIKRLKLSHGQDHDRIVSDLWKEARILGQLKHPQIVELYGVVSDGPATDFAVVTEYMVNGSLKKVLKKRDKTIDRRKRLIMAMDVALGMEHLHQNNIVHFDLKSDNLLVNMRNPQRPVCKIGDLGLSRFKENDLVYGGLRGTLSWMAPELLSSENKMVTEKVDVYSFGIVMWELLTGEEPYANERSEEVIAGIIKGLTRPEVPRWCDPAWRSLMEKCWSSDSDSRPSFSDITKELHKMLILSNIKY